jgi:hypothetical protein
MRALSPHAISAGPQDAVSITDLTQMVDEALALLDHRFPSAPQDQGRPVSPLPSILERCEALIEQSERPAPIRAVLSFSPPGSSWLNRLLASLPNTQLLADLAEAASFHPAALGTAGLAKLVFGSIEPAMRQNGKFPILLLTCMGPRSSGDRLTPADLPRLVTPERPLAALIYASHPLKSWLVARHNGWLPAAPMPLEAYCENYLAFLQDHPGLQIVTDAEIQTDPDLALQRIGQTLDLPFGRLGHVDGVNISPEQADFTQAQSLPAFHFPDGSIATEEALDTPLYLALCRRLGFDPEQLVPEAPPAALREAEALQLRQPLAPFQPGKGSARLAALLPQIAAIADATRPAASPAFVLTTARVVSLVEDCLSHSDGFYERLDQICSALSPADAALLLIASAGHFIGVGENIHGTALLTEAQALIPVNCRALQILAAELYLRNGKPGLALRLLVSDALDGPGQMEPQQRKSLEDSITPLTASKTTEHGHALLINHLENHPPAPSPHRRVMIEIGTTRESVPGQGSTEKLALLCRDLGIDFITVDMDPRNSAMARRMFRRLGLKCRAVTSKGEDFLAEWQGPIDFCFLDAYDFDHGMHSELRQSRYESFLGSRIEDAQCHQMHLDCATSLIAKMAPDGAICFDDTWTDEDGAWTAQGTTAMPYLLANGFRVQSDGNRAALLVRA